MQIRVGSKQRKNSRATTKGQNRFGTFSRLSTLFTLFPPGLSLKIRPNLKGIEENKKKKTNPFSTFVVARLASSNWSSLRQWGVNCCRETSRCLLVAGPSGSASFLVLTEFRVSEFLSAFYPKNLLRLFFRRYPSEVKIPRKSKNNPENGRFILVLQSIFLGAPRRGSGPNWCLEGPPPIPHCNWRTLPSSQKPFPPRPLPPSSPLSLALFAMLRESGTGRPSLVWGGVLGGVEGEGPPAVLGARPTSGGTQSSEIILNDPRKFKTTF